MEITFCSYEAEKKNIQDRLDANEKPLIINIKQCIFTKISLQDDYSCLPFTKKYGNFDWDVNGKSILLFPNGKFWKWA